MEANLAYMVYAVNSVYVPAE